MRLPEDLTGLKASDLSAMEAQIEPLQAKIKEEREKLFKRACHLAISNGYGYIDEAVQDKLEEIVLDLRFALNEIVLGSLYNLNCKFAEGTDIAELLVHVGLFSKNFYYFSNSSRYQDHKFEDKEDVEFSKELVDGVMKYYDPIAGEEVSKAEFEENLYYTLSATRLYKELLDSIVLTMNGLEIE